MTDLLMLGRSGVLAYRGALAAVGENVTNANTEGYSRRQVVLREQDSVTSPYSLNRTSSAFGGVQASQVGRVWDQYRAANAWSTNSDSSRADIRSSYLSTIETTLDNGDAGVGTKLTTVFTSASQLAANPDDAALRQTMLAAVGDAANALKQTGANLTKVAGTIDTQAKTLVEQTNTALAALGKINLALHAAPSGTAARAQLEDQRDTLLGTITAAIGVDVSIDSAGGAGLKLGDYTGVTLLTPDGTSSAYMTLQTASDGRLATTVTEGGVAHAANPTGGALSGMIDAASVTAGRRAQLDGLAGGFVTALNTWQAQGLNKAGAAGVPLLTGTDAATIALATSDPDAIAAATPLGADNGNLLALTALRGPDGVEAGWRAMATDQALLVSSAKTEATAAATRKDSADSSLDEVTGVDLDSEAADLLRFQQAYSASAKIIQAARETLQSILDLF